jgi:hypothetical protein
MMRQAIGALMVAAPFLALAIFTYVMGGAVAVLSIFGAVALVCGLIIGGMHLLLEV